MLTRPNIKELIKTGYDPEKTPNVDNLLSAFDKLFHVKQIPTYEITLKYDPSYNSHGSWVAEVWGDEFWLFEEAVGIGNLDRALALLYISTVHFLEDNETH